MPVPKYRLHATRVDRIAIVDRPAVPKAQIVLFKRLGDGTGVKGDGDAGQILKQAQKDLEELLKYMDIVDFNAEFVIKSAAAAVDILEDGYWEPIRRQAEIDASEREKIWKELFDSFREIVYNVLKKVARKVKADEATKLTTEEVVNSFERYIKAVAITEAFLFFRFNLSSIILGHKRFENPDEVLEQVIGKFQEFVTRMGSEIVEKKLDVPVAVEKEGRKISAARMKKIKDAISVMQSIVDEQESTNKNVKEAEDMELQEIIKKLGEIGAAVEALGSIPARLDKMESELKEHGMLLTPEEKKAKKDEAAAEKKRLKDEKTEQEKREKDEQTEAEKKDLNKRRKELGLEDDATKDDIEKKEKEIADAKAEFEKSLPKTIETITSFMETIGKRFGVKTSLTEEDKETEKKDKGDPFRDALKGRKPAKAGDDKE